MIRILLMLMCLSCHGQTVRDQLLGAWTGTGQLSGLAATATLAWNSELGGKFIKLIYRAELRLKDGKSARFEGDAYYPAQSACQPASPCRATWFDSHGATYELRAEESAGKLTTEWGPAGDARGRSEYRLTSADSLEVTDWVRSKDGTWREFAKLIYQRVPPR